MKTKRSLLGPGVTGILKFLSFEKLFLRTFFMFSIDFRPFKQTKEAASIGRWKSTSTGTNLYYKA